MSGDDLRTTSRAPVTDPPRDSTPSVTPTLLKRVQESKRDATPEEIVSAIAGDLYGGDVEDVNAPETVVTQSLDELLVALIELRDDETHGTGLMEDLGRLFDVQPSPGTVYPRLHELEAEGTLSRHDLVQTKQYSIADEDEAVDLIERAMYQHLTVGLFLRAALDGIETR
jgi:hypothetical protein